MRALRTDLRQEGDLAAVWVTLRRRTPLAGAGPVERDWVEHLVLRRIGSQLADPQRGRLVGAERKSA